jgi:hypothetical protein
VRTVLLDENLPRLLKADLPQFDVSTVREMGWSSVLGWLRDAIASAKPGTVTITPQQ